MKNKLLLLLISILICCCVGAAYADPTSAALQNVTADGVNSDNENSATTCHYPTQAVYRPIQVYTLQPDGSFVLSNEVRQVATITYCYATVWGRQSRTYIGGTVDIASYPQIVESAAPALTPSFQYVMKPAAYGVSIIDSGAAYTFSIGGGYFNISYNSKLYRNTFGNYITTLNGEALDLAPVTVSIAYSYSETGP